MFSLTHIDPDYLYPESDGLPMADNTEQYEWIVKIKENLEILYADDPDIFIAGDLLWYPVKDRKITHPVAPDVMVVFGRSKGKRGSYKQWEEDNIAPQVVFEILSPSNTQQEMEHKLEFYQRYGVEEYYLYDPQKNKLLGWVREGDLLIEIKSINNWMSLRLNIKFKHDEQGLEIYTPQGNKFLTSVELAQNLTLEKQKVKLEKPRAESEKQRAESEKQRAESEKQRADLAEVKLAQMQELLRQAGISLPDD